MLYFVHESKYLSKNRIWVSFLILRVDNPEFKNKLKPFIDLPVLFLHAACVLLC